MIEHFLKPLESLPPELAIPPLAGAAARHWIVRPPGSKSLTNRALLLAALARGRSRIRNALLEADDSRVMLRAVADLGAKVEVEAAERAVTVEGLDGRLRAGAGVTLNLGNAGTATRFLAAAALLADGPVTIDGDERMRQRPIGELAEALERLGAAVEYLPTPGGLARCPPMRITPPKEGPRTEGPLDLGRTQSSQFISALLMLGPWMAGGITLRLRESPVSVSYIELTLALLDRLGAVVKTSEDLRVLRVTAARAEALGLGGFEYEVEADASGATYFWAAAALTPGATCTVRGVPESSFQGDADFPELLGEMGAQVTRPARGEDGFSVRGGARPGPVEADMSRMPDAVMTLAAVASFAGGPSLIRGVRTLRVKESDRVAALRTELAKVGVEVESPLRGDEDAMRITPPKGGVQAGEPVVFETYSDHRMAMALALIGLRRPGVSIRNPACVGKTYPEFWRDFAGLYGPD